MEGKCINTENGDLSVFIQLGVSMRQAQVYLANAQLGQATAAAIAKNVQADRAEIYRALIKLEKRGLTRRCITKPLTFRSVPITEAFSILLQQNAEKHNRIRDETEKFITKFREQNNETSNQENAQCYYLTSGLKAEDYEFKGELEQLQKSKDGIYDWKFLLSGINRHLEESKKALEKGVKIRDITCIPEGAKMPQIVQNLMEVGSFEVRSASTAPMAGIAILDKKLVQIISIPKGYLKEIEVLRSNDPAVVGLAQDYFDIKWQTATIPRWRKKNNALET